MHLSADRHLEAESVATKAPFSHLLVENETPHLLLEVSDYSYSNRAGKLWTCFPPHRLPALEMITQLGHLGKLELK